MQTMMHRGQWGAIQYDRVPSVCMKINKKNFEYHDKERFEVRAAHSSVSMLAQASALHMACRVCTSQHFAAQTATVGHG